MKRLSCYGLGSVVILCVEHAMILPTCLTKTADVKAECGNVHRVLRSCQAQCLNRLSPPTSFFNARATGPAACERDYAIACGLWQSRELVISKHVAVENYALHQRCNNDSFSCENHRACTNLSASRAILKSVILGQEFFHDASLMVQNKFDTIYSLHACP